MTYDTTNITRRGWCPSLPVRPWPALVLIVLFPLSLQTWQADCSEVRESRSVLISGSQPVTVSTHKHSDIQTFGHHELQGFHPEHEDVGSLRQDQNSLQVGSCHQFVDFIFHLCSN